MFEINLEVIGARLKQTREQLRISQKNIAEEIGVLVVTVNRLENAKGASVEVLFTYLNYLKSKGCDISELFEEYFDINRVMNRRDVNENDENSSTLNNFSEQIKNILKIQRDKSFGDYDKLIELVDKLQDLHQG